MTIPSTRHAPATAMPYSLEISVLRIANKLLIQTSHPITTVSESAAAVQAMYTHLERVLLTVAQFQGVMGSTTTILPATVKSTSIGMEISASLTAIKPSMEQVR